ncbi:MAG: hypothetical protein DRN08_06590 [Thermoplasmata archaeon]|nr:MAG: hypothetical protein DRN08_06590 [Thermoplasmata archaeon]
MIEILRVIFGSAFVLFLPGFVWSYVFFEKGKIDEIERIALSFGLSIALVPLAVFWLNWIFKVKINLINTSLVILGLMGIAAGILYVRREKESDEVTDGGI